MTVLYILLYPTFELFYDDCSPLDLGEYLSCTVGRPAPVNHEIVFAVILRTCAMALSSPLFIVSLLRESITGFGGKRKDT